MAVLAQFRAPSPQRSLCKATAIARVPPNEKVTTMCCSEDCEVRMIVAVLSRNPTAKEKR